MAYAEVFLRVIILYWLFVFVDFDEIVDQYCLMLVVRVLDIGGTVVLLWQYWSTISSKSTKTNSQYKIITRKKTSAYAIYNPGPGMYQSNVK
jgi:hypothetical protein